MGNPLPRNSNQYPDGLTYSMLAMLSALLLSLAFGSPLQAATEETPQEKASDAPNVPAAIIGKAPPLKGEAIAYFPGSPRHPAISVFLRETSKAV